MADTRKITIEILSGDGKKTKKSSKKDETNEELSETINKILHPIQTLEAATIAKVFFANQVYQQVKANFWTVVDYTHNRYFSLSEDYMGQVNYNNTKTIYNKAKSYALSAVNGFVSGMTLSGGNPILGATGAILSTAGQAVGDVFSYHERISNYYQSLNSTNAQTEFSRQRIGLYNEGRGTEN